MNYEERSMNESGEFRRKNSNTTMLKLRYTDLTAIKILVYILYMHNRT